MDAGLFSVAWAIIAAAAGLGSVGAAITLALRPARFLDALEFDGGYNALAAVTE